MAVLQFLNQGNGQYIWKTWWDPSPTKALNKAIRSMDPFQCWPRSGPLTWDPSRGVYL